MLQVGETQCVAQHPAIKISNRTWFNLPRSRGPLNSATNKKAINAHPWPLTRFAATSWSQKWQYDLDAEQQRTIRYDFPGDSRVTEAEVCRRTSDVARKWILNKMWCSRGVDRDRASVVVYGSPVGLRDPVKPVWDLDCCAGYSDES